MNREEIRRIMITVNVIDGIYEMIAKNLGVKDNTLALIYALDDGKPHSQKEICEEWLIPRTTLNTIVKECVKKDFIVLEEYHKKEKAIRLTSKGHAFAESVLKKVYEIEAEAMKHTLNEVSPAFIDGLELFAFNLKKEVTNFQKKS